MARKDYLSSPGEMRLHLYAILLIVISPLCVAQNGIPIEYNLMEERPPDTLVGNLTKDSGIDQRYTASEISEMVFSFATQTGKFSSYFTLAPSMGIIRTAQVIDRDKISDCKNLESCPIDLKIMVQPTKYFQIIKVRINLLDKNDNIPSFGQPTMLLRVSETAMPETRFGMPNAEDLDAGENGLTHYRMEPEDGPFGIALANAADGSVDLNLVLKYRLDREEQDEYKLTIYATDGGNPPLSGFTEVTIKVNDANDNNPAFDNDTYEVNLMEDTAPLTTVLRVNAEDPDEGLNGEVVYGFADITAQNYGQLFGINNLTGEIFLRKRLEYEKASEYYLSVLAKDLGPNSLPQYARVVIYVQDTNDHSPLIIVNTLTDTPYAQVAEEAEIGMFVAHVSVEDSDSGPSGEVNCSLESDHFELTQIYLSEYKIVTKIVFDRETKDEYHLNLVCQDRGKPPLTSTKYLPVKIVDENDHEPEFLQSLYNVTVSENLAVGLSIVRISATDEDVDRNGAVKYLLEQEQDSRFISVDPVNGIVRTATKLDYEEYRALRIPILGVDQGVPSHTATTTLQILIRDTDDTPPHFVQDAYQFNVEENLPIQTKVGEVVVDSDLSPGGEIKYSLTIGNLPKEHNETRSDVNDAFIIDQDSGSIFTGQRLDRESQDFYHLTVTATHTRSPQLNSTVSVRVVVSDQNDHAPVIYFPMSSTGSIQVSHATPKGHIVFRINATDADLGNNGTLRYSLKMTSADDIFEVDTESGDVTVVGSLEEVSVCYLILQVQDLGNPPVSTTVNVSIVVNSSLPYFANGVSKPTIWNTTNLFSIGIAAAVFLITLMILIALAIIKKQKEKASLKRRYNCRIQAEKVLRTPPASVPDTNSKSQNNTPKNNDKRKLTEHQKILMDNGSYIVMGDNPTLHLGLDHTTESSTDDILLWPKMDSQLILNPRTHSTVLSKPSPNSSESGVSQCSRVQDSGVDLPSWYDVSQNGQIWSVPSSGVRAQDAEETKSGVVHVRPQTTPNMAMQEQKQQKQKPQKQQQWQHYQHHKQQQMKQQMKQQQQQQKQQQQQQQESRSTTPLTEIEIQVHDMLQMLQKDKDSETSSFTDSGKGPSEEGDNYQRVSPLEPRYTDVRKANKHDIPPVHTIQGHTVTLHDPIKSAERRDRGHHSRHQREASIPEEQEYSHFNKRDNHTRKDVSQELEQYTQSPKIRIPRHHSDHIPSKKSALSMPRRFSDSLTDKSDVSLPEFGEQKVSTLTTTRLNLATESMAKDDDLLSPVHPVCYPHAMQDCDRQRSSEGSAHFLPHTGRVEYVNIPLQGDYNKSGYKDHQSYAGYHEHLNESGNISEESYIGFPEENYIEQNPIYGSSTNYNQQNFAGLNDNCGYDDDDYKRNAQRNQNIYVDHKELDRAGNHGDIGYHSRDNSLDSQRTVIVKGSREANEDPYTCHRDARHIRPNYERQNSGRYTERDFSKPKEDSNGNHRDNSHNQRDRTRGKDNAKDRERAHGKSKTRQYGNYEEKHDGHSKLRKEDLAYTFEHVDMVVKDVIEKYLPSDKPRRRHREEESGTSLDGVSDGETTTSGSYIIDSEQYPAIREGEIIGRDYMLV